MPRIKIQCFCHEAISPESDNPKAKEWCALTACGHIFHLLCIKKWMEQTSSSSTSRFSAKCPNCSVSCDLVSISTKERTNLEQGAALNKRNSKHRKRHALIRLWFDSDVLPGSEPDYLLQQDAFSKADYLLDEGDQCIATIKQSRRVIAIPTQDDNQIATSRQRDSNLAYDEPLSNSPSNRKQQAKSMSENTLSARYSSLFSEAMQEWETSSNNLSLPDYVADVFKSQLSQEFLSHEHKITEQSTQISLHQDEANASRRLADEWRSKVEVLEWEIREQELKTVELEDRNAALQTELTGEVAEWGRERRKLLEKIAQEGTTGANTIVALKRKVSTLEEKVDELSSTRSALKAEIATRLEKSKADQEELRTTRQAAIEEVDMIKGTLKRVEGANKAWEAKVRVYVHCSEAPANVNHVLVLGKIKFEKKKAEVNKLRDDVARLKGHHAKRKGTIPISSQEDGADAILNPELVSKDGCGSHKRRKDIKGKARAVNTLSCTGSLLSAFDSDQDESMPFKIKSCAALVSSKNAKPSRFNFEADLVHPTEGCDDIYRASESDYDQDSDSEVEVMMPRKSPSAESSRNCPVSSRNSETSVPMPTMTDHVSRVFGRRENQTTVSKMDKHLPDFAKGRIEDGMPKMRIRT